jgi:hypothetical protein
VTVVTIKWTTWSSIGISWLPVYVLLRSWFVWLNVCFRNEDSYFSNNFEDFGSLREKKGIYFLLCLALYIKM